MELLEVAARMGLWPKPRGPVVERGVAEVRRRWARIGRHARARHASSSAHLGSHAALAELSGRNVKKICNRLESVE
jgi:hypothetical protein